MTGGNESEQLRIEAGLYEDDLKLNLSNNKLDNLHTEKLKILCQHVGDIILDVFVLLLWHEDTLIFKPDELREIHKTLTELRNKFLPVIEERKKQKEESTQADGS